MDCVHVSDRDGDKGLYLINAVDEVTQFEFIGAVEYISEAFLIPVLTALLKNFPFAVNGFHADNGSEYVNRQVAELLHKLHVGEFTKSRPRRSNDNALVEGKNGSVVRRYLGHGHIPRRFAGAVNAFTQNVLSPFLNYHRPCHFPVATIGADGRVTKRYPYANVATPYDKFQSLDDAAQYLRPGVTLEQLDAFARAASDLDAARTLNAARDELFRAIAAEAAA